MCENRKIWFSLGLISVWSIMICPLARLAAWDHGFAVTLSICRVGVWCHYRNELSHFPHVWNVIPPSQTKQGRKCWVGRKGIGSIRKRCFPLLELSVPLTLSPSRHLVYRCVCQAWKSEMSMAWPLLPKAHAAIPRTTLRGGELFHLRSHTCRASALQANFEQTVFLPHPPKQLGFQAWLRDIIFFTVGLWFIFK